MKRTFGASSTTDEVLEGSELSGRRVLVTGVSAGLGVETARALVAHGAHVIGTARDLTKAERACGIVREAKKRMGGSFELVQLDLADLGSVRRASDTLTAQGHPFDLVIANAGVMATPFERTRDGFELQFGTNVLGHFVLVNRVALSLREGGRLVMLTSSGHRVADVDLDDPNFDHTPYDPWIAYGRSKTGDALIAVAFDRRHRARGIRATSVHPGIIRTELSRHLDQAAMAETQSLVQHKSLPQGAATSVWAGVVADGNTVGGRYCEDCGIGDVVANDIPISPVAGGVRPYALDPEHAEAFWKKAEQMVGERF